MEDPFIRHVRLHAKRRLIFEPGTDRSRILGAYKEFLQVENELHQRYHRRAGSGLRVARARSCIIDAVVQSLFHHAMETARKVNGSIPCPVAVAALGSYGRAELNPFSDIDIMFLYPDRVKSPKLPLLLQLLTDTMLYVLWDLKLKVGHSTRTPKQTIEVSRESMETKTGLLEARCVAGQKKLFGDFKRVFKRFYRESSPQAYLEALLKVQIARRHKFGDTVFLQEPEIKNGVGGLRDYQNILWMSQVKLGIDSMESLQHRKFLGQEEFRKLTSGYDFLLKVRHELHFSSRRLTDLLNLEKQPAVACGLGYRQHDIFERVEAFMRDYYTHARNVYQIARVLEKRLAAKAPVPRQRQRRPGRGFFGREKWQRLDGFILTGDTLSFGDRNVFEKDPERLIRIFRHSQQYRAQMDPELDGLIVASLPLLTNRVVNSPTANRSFRSILQTVGEVYPYLSRMHDLGILQRIVPEFSNLTCLVQHEYYHRYTADIHTLNTIREVDRVFSGESDYGETYNREIHATRNPSLIYPMLLLHDIGKGFGISGHAETGARMAEVVLNRMQIGTATVEQIAFIVRNHLEMARVWQRFDVEDPRTAIAFAKLVRDEDTLRYLYVLTFCDAKGTASSLWNDYKNMLHFQLFCNTFEHLGDREILTLKRKAKLKITVAQLEKEAPLLPREEIEAHVDLLPKSYFVDNGIDEIVSHLDMINRFLNHLNDTDGIESTLPVIDWRDDVNMSMTIVSLATWDRPGLFFKLAGAFSVAGLNILGSRVLSRSDNIMVDTFFVCEPGGGTVENKSARRVFQESLRKALVDQEDLLADILEQAEKAKRPAYLRPRTNLRASIPARVEIYHEPSLHRDIVEIQTTDQIGILYRIGRAIYEHGFDITFARILTERGIAVDTFYLANIDELKVDNTAELTALEKILNSIVNET